jgi:hypothetical protein
MHPLLGSAVSERLRDDVTAGHFLQAIIADSRRSAERRFHISLF